MPEPKFTKSQRRDESKRKADESPPAERPTKKTSTTEFRNGKRQAKVTADPSKEALFQAKHAAEFDSHSVEEESASQVQVKPERLHVNGTTVALPQYPKVPSAMPSGSMSPLVIVPTPRSVINTEHDVDQDDVIVAILSQDTWDDNMTKMAVDNLFERARYRTSGGHLFDAEYLDRLLDRLDSAGIKAKRRSEVVGLLKISSRRLLSDWSARVDRIDTPASPRVLPRILPTETRKATSPSLTMAPTRCRLLDMNNNAETVDVPYIRKSSTSLINSRKFWSGQTEGQSERDYTGDRRDDVSTSATEKFSAPSSMNVPSIPRGVFPSTTSAYTAQSVQRHPSICSRDL